jgi:hypothetical protein
MKSDVLNHFQGALKLMADFELTLAELYRTCSQIWPDNKYFWILYERAEVKHSQQLNKIIEMVMERPEVFELGRPLSPPLSR